MSEYELTPAAEDDLLGIARYTMKTWGQVQAARYGGALASHFAALGRGVPWTSTPIEHRPELRSSRCQKHYVFSLQREGTCPLILAVLHEGMDLMERLRERLEPGG